MIEKISRIRREYLPAAMVAAAMLVLALGLHMAQAYTGPLSISAPRGSRFEHGDFSIGNEEYPRAVEDHEGYSMTIKRPTRRIASTQWGIDEFVYSVAAPETVVAVNSSAYERRISNVYELAEKYRPAVAANAEVLFKVAPDLVLDTSGRGPEFSEMLRAGGVPLYRMFTLFTRLEEVANNILLTGYLTGRDEEARRVYDEFQAAVRRAESRKPAGVPSPRILGFAGKYSYGNETLFNDIVRAVGGINVAAEHGLRGYDAVTTEQVLRWNPDWIVGGAGQGQSDAVLRRLMEDPALGLTSAARKGQIVIFEHRIFLAMSPFTRLILDALSETLYSRKEEN